MQKELPTGIGEPQTRQRLEGAAGAGFTGALSARTRLPQAVQKLLPGGIGEPHTVQRAADASGAVPYGGTAGGRGREGAETVPEAEKGLLEAVFGSVPTSLL